MAGRQKRNPIFTLVFFLNEKPKTWDIVETRKLQSACFDCGTSAKLDWNGTTVSCIIWASANQRATLENRHSSVVSRIISDLPLEATSLPAHLLRKENTEPILHSSIRAGSLPPLRPSKRLCKKQEAHIIRRGSGMGSSHNPTSQIPWRPDFQQIHPSTLPALNSCRVGGNSVHSGDTEDDDYRPNGRAFDQYEFRADSPGRNLSKCDSSIEVLQRIEAKMDAEIQRQKEKDAISLELLQSIDQSLAALAQNSGSSFIRSSSPDRVATGAATKQPLCPVRDVMDDPKWDDRKFTSGKMQDIGRKLATELASRSIFGDDVLKKHNVNQGNSMFPALDPKRMQEIEKTVKDKLETIWPVIQAAQWRDVWSNCRTGIQTKITNLRANRIATLTAGQLLNLDQSEIPPH